MNDALQFLSIRKNLDALLFAITGWGIIFLFTRHGGIGLSPDSLAYIATARNLYANHSLSAFNNYPLTDFPAFYPIFLSSVLFITKIDPVILDLF